jgi:hypothetical protein
MPQQSDRFRLLAHQVESLVERLNDFPPPSLDERTKVLRRMKVLIVEIDMLIMSDLRRDSQEASSFPPPDQSAADM